MIEKSKIGCHVAALLSALCGPDARSRARSSNGKVASWRFDLPSQDATQGIAAFLGQAGAIQVLASQDALRGRRTNRLLGTFRIEAALTRLLAGSGLRWLRTGQSTYAIVKNTADKKATTARHHDATSTAQVIA